MGKWKNKRWRGRRWVRNKLIEKYGSKCYLCEEDFASLKQITIDHYIPKSKGGPEDISNFRLAHEKCNSLKADMLYEDFLEFQESLK